MGITSKRLVTLGRRRKKLLASVAENMEEIHEEIRVFRKAGATQDDITRDSNLSRVTVQRILKKSGSKS
jgi:uncharacterized membrane protein